MSLINQMLKDLEQRNAVNLDSRRPLSGEVRAASGERRRWLLPLLGGLLIVLTGAAYLWMQHTLLQPAGVAQAEAPPHTAAITPPLKSGDISPAQIDVPEAIALTSPVINGGSAPTTPDTTQPILATEPETNVAESATKSMPLLERELRNSWPEPLAQENVPTTKPARTVKEATEAPIGNTEPVAAPAKSRTKPKANADAKSVHQDQPTGKQISPEQKSTNYYRQALQFLQEGRVAEAQGVLLQALEANRLNNNARLTLAGLLVENKRNDEARAVLQTGIEVAPEQSAFNLALSRLQLEAGNSVAALTTLEKGLPNAKNDADYHGFLATLLQRDRRHDEAINHYLIALEGKSVTSWLVGLGISLQAIGRLNEARQAFERAQHSANLSPDLAQFVDQRLKQLHQQLR